MNDPDALTDLADCWHFSVRADGTIALALDLDTGVLPHVVFTWETGELTAMQALACPLPFEIATLALQLDSLVCRWHDLDRAAKPWPTAEDGGAGLDTPRLTAAVQEAAALARDDLTDWIVRTRRSLVDALGHDGVDIPQRTVQGVAEYATDIVP